MSQHTEFKVGDIVNFHSVAIDNTEYEIVIIDEYGLKFKGFENCGYFDSKDFKLLKTNQFIQHPLWKIESDGTNAGTKVWINGDRVDNLLQVVFTAYVSSAPRLNIFLGGKK